MNWALRETRSIYVRSAIKASWWLWALACLPQISAQGVPPSTGQNVPPGGQDKNYLITSDTTGESTFTGTNPAPAFVVSGTGPNGWAGYGTVTETGAKWI